MNPLSKELEFLLKHSSIYGLGNILSRAVSFLLLPLYTRYLTLQDYGILELIDVTTNMLGIVIGVGISQAMSQFYHEGSGEKDCNRVVSTIYIIIAVISGTSLVLAGTQANLLAVWVLDSAIYGHYFVVAFGSLLCGIVIDAGQIYLRLLYKSAMYVSISIASLVVGVFLNVLFVVYLDYGVVGVLYGNLFTKVLLVVPLTGIILFRVGLSFDWSLAKQMLRYSLFLLPAEITHVVVNYSDRYFIKHYVSIADAGLYGLANKIGTSLHFLVTSPFIMTFLPRRFEIAKQLNARQVFCKVFDYYCLLFVSIGLVLSVFVDEIMRVMTTREFYRAGTLVPLIVLTMFVLGAKYHFEFGILYEKKTQYYSYVNILTAGIHLALNFVLVRDYGLWGALYASLIAVFLTTALVYVVSYRLYPIDFDYGRNLKILAVAALLYGASVYAPTNIVWIHIIYKLMIVSVFPFLLIWVRALSDVEVSKIKQMRLNVLSWVRM